MTPPLTNDLIRRLELHMARGIVLDPDGATYAIYGQTVCSKAHGGRPRNKVFCFAKTDVDQLGRIISFYAHDKLDLTFYLSPAGFCAEVAAALSHKGFVHREFEQAILYGRPQQAPATLPAEVTIEPVTTANHDTFVATLANGHEWDPAWRDHAVRDTREKFAQETPEITQRRHRFLARVNGEPAGVGAIEIRDGIASLAAGGVVPAFRCRGVHTALLQHRLHLAHQLGAELVMSGASVSSTSFRNQQRAGLQIAYIEAGWRRK